MNPLSWFMILTKQALHTVWTVNKSSIWSSIHAAYLSTLLGCLTVYYSFHNSNYLMHCLLYYNNTDFLFQYFRWCCLQVFINNVTSHLFIASHYWYQNQNNLEGNPFLFAGWQERKYWQSRQIVSGVFLYNHGCYILADYSSVNSAHSFCYSGQLMVEQSGLMASVWLCHWICDISTRAVYVVVESKWYNIV